MAYADDYVLTDEELRGLASDIRALAHAARPDTTMDEIVRASPILRRQLHEATPNRSTGIKDELDQTLVRAWAQLDMGDLPTFTAHRLLPGVPPTFVIAGGGEDIRPNYRLRTDRAFGPSSMSFHTEHGIVTQRIEGGFDSLSIGDESFANGIRTGANMGFETATLELADWLDGPFMVAQGERVTRLQLILYITNQVGGAHTTRGPRAKHLRKPFAILQAVDKDLTECGRNISIYAMMSLMQQYTSSPAIIRLCETIESRLVGLLRR